MCPIIGEFDSVVVLGFIITGGGLDGFVVVVLATEPVFSIDVGTVILCVDVTTGVELNCGIVVLAIALVDAVAVVAVGVVIVAVV